MSLKLLHYLWLLWSVQAALMYSTGLDFKWNKNVFCSILSNLNTLTIHLRTPSDITHQVAQHLLNQSTIIIPLILIMGSTNEGSIAGHHLFVYDNLTELKSGLQPTFNYGADAHIYVFNNIPQHLELLRFASEIWQKHNFYKAYYMLNDSIVYFNPFSLSEHGFGAIIPANKSSFQSIFHNMNGYSLKVYIFTSILASVSLNNATQHVSGISGTDSEVAELVSRKMNFTMDLQWPIDDYYGFRLPNGSYSGGLGRVIHGDTDIIFSGYFIKDYLTQDIDFTVAVYTDNLCCVVKKAKRVPQSLLPLFALKFNIWLCYVFMGFLSSFMWLIIRYLFNVYIIKHTNIDYWTQYYRILVDTWIVWVRVNNVNFPKYNSERLLVISICLTSVIFGALLESSLATIHIKPLYYKDINTLHELDEVNLRIFVKHPAFKDDLFKPYLTEVYEHLDRKMVILSNNKERLITMISRDGKFAGVVRQKALLLNDTKYIMTNQIHMIPECPKSYNIAYLLKKNSPYLNTLNLILLHINEAGLINKSINDMERSAKLSLINIAHELADMSNKWKVLTIKDVQLAFYILSLGCLSALIVLMLEKWLIFSNLMVIFRH